MEKPAFFIRTALITFIYEWKLFKCIYTVNKKRKESKGIVFVVGGVDSPGKITSSAK